MKNAMNANPNINIEDYTGPLPSCWNAQPENAVINLPFSDLDDLTISRGPVADAYLEQAFSLSLDRYLNDDELYFLSKKFYCEIYEYIVDNR